MKLFKKHDLIIIGTILVLALAAFVAVRIIGASPASYVEVSVNGRVTATYPIYVDGEYTVRTDVTLVIHNGTVDVTCADCPNQICVNHAPISRTGESIACLPNRILITIRGDASDVDAIAR